MCADMGGTNILDPLTESIKNLAPNHKETRIFLLTDGMVDDCETVIATADTKNDNIRVHTFGIGTGCDRNMVQRVAQNGRGSCSLVVDDVENLNGLVVTALSRAFEPSLQGCSLKFGDKTIDLGEVFRGQIITKCQIVSTNQFEAIQVAFKCFDPVQKSTIDFQFTSGHFDRVEEGFGLFKIAARDEIASLAKLKKHEKINLSKKYQILCDETAFVGVIKQKDKATG